MGTLAYQTDVIFKDKVLVGFTDMNAVFLLAVNQEHK